MWTLLYALCTGITHFYTNYYWGSDDVNNLLFAETVPWLFGLWLICLFLLVATAFTTGSGALGGTAIAVFVVYLTGMIPKVSEYLPTRLLSGMPLLTGEKVPADYMASVIVTLVTGALMLAGAVLIFKKKQL